MSTLALVSDEYADDDDRIIELVHNSRERIDAELSKVIIGQHAVVEQLLVSLFAGGHCLLTGAPGLAKTLLVNSIAELFTLKFNRIQFTPDLMPADITGTDILAQSEDGSRRLTFQPGPLFANVVLADEINRTPPKTQAALLEAMQEAQVTASGKRHPLERPFFVLATQNPVEMEGTYPLPEAQLDRFMFNILVEYLTEDEEVTVVSRTTQAPPEPITPLFSTNDIRRIHQVVRQVPVSEELVRYAVKLCAASRPDQETTPEPIQEYVTWGAGLRGAQNLILAAKAKALLSGRVHVTLDDIRTLLAPTLRHRILLNYRAEADGLSPDDIVTMLQELIPTP